MPQKRTGQIKRLNELQKGEYGKIVSYNNPNNYSNDESGKLNEEAHRNLKRHLMSMGFVKDAEIKFLKVAPLGDPIKVKVKGYDLALRKEEAQNIKVEIK